MREDDIIAMIGLIARRASRRAPPAPRTAFPFSTFSLFQE
jgi:hypothetical protein